MTKLQIRMRQVDQVKDFVDLLSKYPHFSFPSFFFNPPPPFSPFSFFLLFPFNLFPSPQRGV